MQQHGYDAHEGKVAVVLYARAAHGSHQVAAEEAELGVVVHLAERCHKTRGMQVARSLASYQVIFHVLIIRNSSESHSR